MSRRDVRVERHRAIMGLSGPPSAMRTAHGLVCLGQIELAWVEFAAAPHLHLAVLLDLVRVWCQQQAQKLGVALGPPQSSGGHARAPSMQLAAFGVGFCVSRFSSSIACAQLSP